MNVRASIQMLGFTTVLLTLGPIACSSGGGGGVASYGDAGSNASRSSGSTTPGAAGSSRPAGATSVTCSKSSECGNWVCECNDGPVNATNCTNGYCLDAEHTCPKACSDYKATWTGTASGGPTTAKSSSPSSPSPSPSATSSAGSCTLHTDCPKMVCTCTSGFTTSDLEVQSCDPSTHVCRASAEACPDACAQDGLQWVGR